MTKQVDHLAYEQKLFKHEFQNQKLRHLLNMKVENHDDYSYTYIGIHKEIYTYMHILKYDMKIYIHTYILYFIAN